MDDYVKSQSRAAYVLTNDVLKCKDCIYRDDGVATAFCVVFQQAKGERKPNSVLLKGDCPEYVQRIEKKS